MSKSEFDRSSRDDVFRVIDEQLPTPEARRAFAELAGRAIEAVHRVEPRGWGITVKGHWLCLNLGAVAFLGVGRREAWVLVLDEGEAAPEDLGAKVYKGVKSFPGSRGLGVPVASFPKLLAWAEASIDRLLERVIEKAWRCPYRESHTPAAVDYFAEQIGRGLPQPLMPSSRESAELSFGELMEEFLSSYWPTEECQRSMALYTSSRIQARTNLDRARGLEGSGRESEFQQAVIGGLLPHDGSDRNVRAGNWVGVAPSGMMDVPAALEGKGIVKEGQWPAVTRGLLKFVVQATSAPDQLEKACEEFLRTVPRGFQAGMLSPILNALAPDSFVTANRKSLNVLAQLGGPRVGPRLEDYPEANRAIRTLIEENAELFERPEFEAHRVEDVFDHFCHWIEAVREEDVSDADADALGAPGRAQVEGDARPWLAPRAFELLADLRRSPTKETYSASKVEFRRELEGPFRELFQRLAARLPQRIRDVCETKKHVVGRFLKNDWGQGGAYDFLWGAFYPRGGRRVGGPQLYASANQDLVRFGFSFADEDDAALSVFQERLIRDERQLVRALPSEVRGHRLYYGEFSHADGFKLKETLAGSDALPSLIRSGRLTIARGGLDRDAVLSMPRREVEDLILATFEGLFPLFERSLGLARPVGDGTATEEDEEEQIPFGSGADEVQSHPAYSLQDLARDTSLPATAMQDWLRALDRKGQAIVYGPPGTGKTFLAEKLAKHLVGGGDGLLETVQFHPAYGYEDFIQGIRPRTVSGSVSYDLVDGRFVDFCKRVEQRTGTSVLIVDEINRANLPRVFGELMYLLEYRDKEIRLASGTRFRIPPRVRVLGTMNTADRSIALVDHALRRRFAFLKLEPQFDVLRKHHETSGFPIERWIAILQRVNLRIADPNHSIGISYFLRPDLDDQLESIWRHEILPYLEEFFFDDASALTEFQWERVAEEIGR